MKTRRKGFTIVEMLIVILVVGILAAITIPQIRSLLKERVSYKEYVSQKVSCGAPYISVPNENRLGGINFPVRYGWNKVDILFTDYGFDGTLDSVNYKDEKERKADPNSSDWNIWVERYFQVRTAATTGKQNLQWYIK